jgi:D-alanyl-D-alanine carboxypeptidase (penicillin-binding protein 5/6)
MIGGKEKLSFWVLSAIAALGAVWLAVLFVVSQPAQPLDLQVKVPTLSATADTLTFAWPEQGTAAIAMDGAVKASFNGDEVRAMASVAKVITALVVLEAKPLGVTDAGPNLTMTEADVARYDTAKSGGQSNLEVKVGQTITQRQMLDGVMLASANNLAESLAIWAFG